MQGSLSRRDSCKSGVHQRLQTTLAAANRPLGSRTFFYFLIFLLQTLTSWIGDEQLNELIGV